MVAQRSVLEAGSLVEARTCPGVVAGLSDGGVIAFKGIAYGASTGGPNRFRSPQPVEPWSGVHDASSCGDACPQPSMAGVLAPDVEQAIEFVMVAGDRFGEDCLSLNVWTPGVDDASRPVMVWLHGGGQTLGSGNMPIYDGSNLARAGDVVVVNVNHRLGVLGYLSLTEVGGLAYPTSGNNGLLDMVAALEWVRDNIASFGGDPENVTIFGESGGGHKVSVLLGTPAAEGLFHKAIIQSGPGLRAHEPAAAATTTAAIIEALGLSTIDELVAVPVDHLIAAQLAVLGHLGIETGNVVGPIMDGTILPTHPFDPVASPSAARVPVLIGTTRDETTLFQHGNPIFENLDHAAAAQMAPNLARGITDLYPTYRRTRPDATPAQLLAAIATDDWFRIASIRLAERKLAAGSAPVWMYRCDVQSPAVGGALGATHGIDIALMFDNLPVPLLDGHPGADRVAKAMSSAWCSFARTGDPSHHLVPEWPPYSLDDRPTMLFNTVSALANDPDGEERLAWGDRTPA